MSSYVLLGALSGFRYSAVEMILWFGPQLNIRLFKSFFSTASGFSVIALDSRSVRVEMMEGELPIEKLALTVGGETRVIDWKVIARTNAAAVKVI